MSTPEKFSHRLRNLRIAMGLSQDAFAQRLGVSRNYVSMIEGGREPSNALIKFFETIEREHFNLPSSSDDGSVREDSAHRYGDQPKVTVSVSPETRARLRTLSEKSGIHEDSLVGYALAMYLAECESKKQIIIPMP